ARTWQRLVEKVARLAAAVLRMLARRRTLQRTRSDNKPCLIGSLAARHSRQKTCGAGHYGQRRCGRGVSGVSRTPLNTILLLSGLILPLILSHKKVNFRTMTRVRLIRPSDPRRPCPPRLQNRRPD